MGMFDSIVTAGVEKIVDVALDGIDKLFTSDDERLAHKTKLTIATQEFKLKLEEGLNRYKEEVTKRWQSDNEHMATRLVRPLSFAWVIVLFSVIIVGDSNFGFSVKEAYIPVMETLLTTMTIAYFGSRGVEKGIKHFKGAN